MCEQGNKCVYNERNIVHHWGTAELTTQTVGKKYFVSITTAGKEKCLV